MRERLKKEVFPLNIFYYVNIKVKLATVVKGDPKALF